MSNEISSKQIEHVRFVSTLSKGRNFTINSFDIVAGVDGALILRDDATNLVQWGIKAESDL